MRCIGMAPAIFWRAAEPCGWFCWNSSVSTGPGATQLTVMPSLATSSASERVIEATAALLPP